MTKKPPIKPADMNGRDAAIWGFLLHLNERIDDVSNAGRTRTLAILLAVIATLVTVVLK